MKNWFFLIYFYNFFLVMKNKQIILRKLKGNNNVFCLKIWTCIFFIQIKPIMSYLYNVFIGISHINKLWIKPIITKILGSISKTTKFSWSNRHQLLMPLTNPVLGPLGATIRNRIDMKTPIEHILGICKIIVINKIVARGVGNALSYVLLTLGILEISRCCGRSCSWRCWWSNWYSIKKYFRSCKY